MRAEGPMQPVRNQRFPHPRVTSNLAMPSKRADHVPADGSIEREHEKARKSFVVKILTSNPLGLKILQGLFAEPAPVKAFKGGGTHEITGLPRNETT